MKRYNQIKEKTVFIVTIERMTSSDIDIVEQHKFESKKEADKRKKELTKKYSLINHGGHIVNYKKNLELFTNY